MTDNLIIIKNSLGIVGDGFDDELKGYLAAAKSYIDASLPSDKIAALSDDMRYTVAQQQIAIYLWTSRGDSTSPRDALPFTLQTLINNLIYN